MAIVLYASDKKTSDDQVSLVVRGFQARGAKDVTVYIRAELMEDIWPGPAVKKATPSPDEVVLNAVPNKVIIRK